MIHRLAEPESRSRSRSTTDGALVLLVEDDDAQRTVLTAALSARGLRIVTAATGLDALETAEMTRPDVVILDLHLPDIDGAQICRRLRTICDCAVVVVTGDALEARMIDVLDRGADDYVVKPVSIDVLMARIRVAMRHLVAAAPVVDEQRLECGDLRLDLAAYQAIVGGQVVDMLPRQFELLAALVRNAGKVMTYSALVRMVWGVTDTTEHISPLRTSISKVRKAIGTGPNRPSIHTEQGVGYRLVAP